jgi:two-component system cell cycle response regulator
MTPDSKTVDAEDSRADLNDTILLHHLQAAPACRVLIVDDDDLVRARLAALLRMSNFEVELAGSGEEALSILSGAPCQIVLTDWQMPDMDGLALCRYLRTACYESYVYVVMLTVRDSKQDVLTGLAAGADDYVLKGTPIEEILARIEIGRRITHVEQSLRTSNRENRRLATTDPLTGAHNLRYLVKHLPRELARCRRYDHPLAILSCDIDEFKHVNDHFGHQAGDLVLQAFVSRSSSCLRKASDWLARTGGDEFVIVLPETTLSGANSVARKLRQMLAALPVATSAGPVPFMASVGVTAVEPAHVPTGPSAVKDLLHIADRNLYASKRGVKDGVDQAPPAR